MPKPNKFSPRVYPLSRADRKIIAACIESTKGAGRNALGVARGLRKLRADARGGGKESC